MQDQWLSIAEYARHFNISDMTVRRRIKTGKIHAILKDGKYFIPLDSEDAPWKPPATTSDAPLHSPGQHRSFQTNPRDRYVSPGSRNFYSDSRNQRKQNSGSFNQPTVRPGQAFTSTQNSSGYSHRDYDNDQHSMNRPHNSQPHLRQGHIPAPKDHYKPTNMFSQPDTTALVQSCASMLKKLEEAEANIRDLADSKEKILREKIKTLEEEVTSRDLKLNHLNQKVEDMQTLIKMIGFQDSQSVKPE